MTAEVKKLADRAIIPVTDDGVGIPVDEYQHVFKRFYRLERSRRSGNGLDLNLLAAVPCLHQARQQGCAAKLQLQFPLFYGASMCDVLNAAYVWCFRRRHGQTRKRDGLRRAQIKSNRLAVN